MGQQGTQPGSGPSTSNREEFDINEVTMGASSPPWRLQGTCPTYGGCLASLRHSRYVLQALRQLGSGEEAAEAEQRVRAGHERAVQALRAARGRCLA